MAVLHHSFTVLHLPSQYLTYATKACNIFYYEPLLADVMPSTVQCTEYPTFEDYIFFSDGYGLVCAVPTRDPL